MTSLSIQSFAGDKLALLPILEPAIREGRSYPVNPAASHAEILAYWFAPGNSICVARNPAGSAIGTYYLKANSTGPAAHVANAGYMVHPEARRCGVGRAMAHDSFTRARAAGYRAMQFNLVIASNAAARALWREVGMEEVGRLKGAFRMPDGTYDDALVLYREL